ncbi:MAG: hypothetical protein GVY14_00645 [Spirochaetes bacterium]|jgi:hypothetical protein|nr:hypothetical protein [Spirochaetota bacterium]
MEYCSVSKLPRFAGRQCVLVALVLVLPALPVIAAGASASHEARLEYAADVGELTVRDGEGDAVLPVELGMDVPLGGSLETRRTTAELLLEPNHAVLRVARQTTVHLERLSKRRRGRTRLRLDEGSLRSIVEALTGSKRFEVSTPGAVVGVRGTDFRIDVDPGVREVVVVFDGEVEVRRDDGEKSTLTAGQSVNILDPDLSTEDLDDSELDELEDESEPEELDREDVETEEDDDDDDDGADDGDQDDDPADEDDDDSARDGSDSAADDGDSGDTSGSDGGTSGGDSDSGDSDSDGGDDEED